MSLGAVLTKRKAPQHLAPRDASRVSGGPRRRVGLALGGGSARGWAHIGIIRELRDAGVPLDVIAGTSIGAVVGGCAAAGKLDELEAFALSLNRRRMLGLMDISFAGSALIGGARLRRRLSRDLGDVRIEGLPTPFAAVATELGSGREVCLSHGDLVEAVRASYAMPGLFEPVRISGRWLFDGAMSNPVPVSVCRTLGADFVIAVSLTSDIDEAATSGSASLLGDEVESAVVPAGRTTKRRRLRFARRRLFERRVDGAPGIASVMVNAFSVAQERISRARLAYDRPEVLIPARLDSVGLFDFHRAANLVAHGRRVAREALPAIEAQLSGIAPEALSDPTAAQ